MSYTILPSKLKASKKNRKNYRENNSPHTHTHAHLLPVNIIQFLFLPEKAPMCCVIHPNSVLTN
jgi:hypothetical protein